MELGTRYKWYLDMFRIFYNMEYTLDRNRLMVNMMYLLRNMDNDDFHWYVFDSVELIVDKLQYYINEIEEFYNSGETIVSIFNRRNVHRYRDTLEIAEHMNDLEQWTDLLVKADFSGAARALSRVKELDNEKNDWQKGWC